MADQPIPVDTKPISQQGVAADSSQSGSTLERLLSLVDEQLEGLADHPHQTQLPRAPSATPGSNMRAASEGQATLTVAFITKSCAAGALVQYLEGHEEEVSIDSHVDPSLVGEAIAARSLALLAYPNGKPTIVGLVQTQRPEHTVIHAKKIHIEADEQITIRSGRSLIELRSDGALEILGTRISATSRGIFRLVGRALRLN